jgi:hypothetical protein
MQATILARLAGGAGMPAPPLALRSCQLIRQGTAGDVARAPDAESAQWVSALSGCGAERDHAVARLHEALLRVARAELARRAGQLRSPARSWMTWPSRRPPTQSSPRSGNSAARAASPRGRTGSSSWRYPPRLAGTSGVSPTCRWTPGTGTSCQTGSAWAHARKTVQVTVGPDTCQIAVEPGITVTAARTSSRDIRRHKASNYPSQPGVYALPCDDQL